MFSNVGAYFVAQSANIAPKYACPQGANDETMPAWRCFKDAGPAKRAPDSTTSVAPSGRRQASARWLRLGPPPWLRPLFRHEKCTERVCLEKGQATLGNDSPLSMLRS